MKTSQSLGFFINQLQSSARPTRPFFSPLKQFLSHTAPTNRCLHTRLSKPKSITSLSRAQHIPLTSPCIRQNQRRPKSTDAPPPPGSSFSPQTSQNAIDSPSTEPLPTSNTDQTTSSPPESPLTESPPTSETDQTASPPSNSPPTKRPTYQLVFTCKPCGFRSGHTISKHGYHAGTVLITCPECKNRHVISDHLKIFSDVLLTLDELLRDKGELVKRGSITENGDIEFWDEASEKQERTPPALKKRLLENLTTEQEKKWEYAEWKARERMFKEKGLHGGMNGEWKEGEEGGMEGRGENGNVKDGEGRGKDLRGRTNDTK